MEPHLKIDVSSASGSTTTGATASTSEAPQDSQAQQTMPPPSSDWSNQFNSPEAEDMGPFVEQLLPFVRASAYNWFHLQAAKRRHFKEFDKKMCASEENAKLAELQNDRDELKVKWASRLLGKIKKDIQNDDKEAFISAINGSEPNKCIISVADQKGKMRRIDCLRQADKVWRLDLVTIILFKGIPLESTDGERLERSEACVHPLCINPFHMAISVRGLDVFMANYLKDVDTKITLTYPRNDELSDTVMVKQEPGEQTIVAPHAVLGTSSTHTRVWETNSERNAETIIITYDPQKACHTYFGGRATLAQQSLSAGNTYMVNKTAVDNNFFNAKRSVLCLPPPPIQNCFPYPIAGTSDSQQMDMSEDSNDGPSEKRSRDISSHDSPNSSTNDEVRRIVESGTEKLVLGSSIWAAPGQFSRTQQNQGAPGTSRQVRPLPDFQSQDSARSPGAFRSTAKPVCRMTVNTGNHGDVGVVVVDERNREHVIHAQHIVNALSSLRTTPSMRESPVGRKRMHPHTSNSFEFLNCNQEMNKNEGALGSDISPTHTAVSNLISRESSGYMASPTKFTTARGDTTSFSKIFQKIEEKHLQHNQPSTSYCNSQIQPPILSSKPVDSSVKLIAPVAVKPIMSGCNSIIPSPITTPRITPSFRMLEDDSLINVLGQLAHSNDGTTLNDSFIQHLIDTNSRSPLLSSGNAFSALSMGAVSGLVPGNSIHRPDSSASNGSNSLGVAMGLAVPQNIALAVQQTQNAMSPLHQIRVSVGAPPACSPSSSNSSLGAANQAPVSNTPQDPNAPKLPTDFSHALRNEKK
ncbi:Nuclear factor I family protein [Caenorhabditis elegans]|uniref:Isoform a of Nuclear factor I family protein n=1 Tax=Caenorhabditis elegans TaxID=6239 RepID=Q5H9N3-3|nr:Nuclear factor I family protein [Caenorhabditis elegans]CCD65933.1 Nuclear factor I family protein [Caenorhabditis elegans]|eukprot:NP_001022505.1 NFI (Nuclear Factor I) family [Caenorhabditis elegans]